MLKILICEDEKDWSDHFKNLIHEKFEKTALVRICSSENEIHVLEEKDQDFDVVLMDICLGDKNGITLAADLHQRHPGWKFIFVSGYIDEYIEGMFLKIRPYGVLKKPVNDGLFIRMLEMLSQDNPSEHGIVLKLYRGKIRKLLFDEIIYFESNKRIVNIHMTNGEEQCYEKLDNLEQQLPDSFLRCHKSFLVNMDKITGFLPNGIQLSDGTVASVSRTKLKESKQKYFQYLGMGL